mmetsp:Transcript_108323/g.231289  ORF Transcript_108323/g.231289 Transcript_108323/m.231289 type:complete len:224 (-) Transcript_108323:2787-3458(-)
MGGTEVDDAGYIALSAVGVPEACGPTRHRRRTTSKCGIRRSARAALHSNSHIAAFAMPIHGGLHVAQGHGDRVRALALQVGPWHYPVSVAIVHWTCGDGAGQSEGSQALYSARLTPLHRAGWTVGDIKGACIFADVRRRRCARHRRLATPQYGLHHTVLADLTRAPPDTDISLTAAPSAIRILHIAVRGRQGVRTIIHGAVLPGPRERSVWVGVALWATCIAV